MKVKRIYSDLASRIKPNKVLVILGPRQVGKTTLVKDFLANINLKYKFVIGDNLEIADILSSQRLGTLKKFIEGYELLVVDEAQKIDHIGINLKLLVDSIPGIKIIATGSSSFELLGQVGEPLTGRKRTLQLFPVSLIELKVHYNEFELDQKLDEFLIFGTYPEVVTTTKSGEKKILLEEIAYSYLLKDILELEKVKSSRLLLDLLRLLAFQIGSEVSLNELARKLKIDIKTVARYLDLFEKSFIIKSLGGYSNNLRKEVSKKNKYYFYDNGIRNALIANFNPINLRNDTGILWENFIVMERLKKQSYHDIISNNYFWRTYDKKEIDFVEEREGKLFGYEIKFGHQSQKAPKGWLETYKNASYHVINRDNYLAFVT